MATVATASEVTMNATSLVDSVLRALPKFDLAAGLRQDVITDFCRAHHTVEHAKEENVYVGHGDLADLRLSYTYDIVAPAVVDLAPIRDDAKETYRRWAESLPKLLGARDKGSSDYATGSVAPTLKVRVPAIEITITPTGENPVKFRFALTILACTAVNEGGLLQFVPISGEVENQKEFDRAVTDAVRRSGHPAGQSDGTCYELKELIRHVVNTVIAQHIESFVLDMQLPLPIKLFDSVHLSHVDVAVVEDHVVLAALATPKRAALEPESLKELLADPHAAQEFADATKQVIRKPPSEEQVTIVSIDDAHRPPDVPANGVFLLLTQEFLQRLASELVRLDEKGGGSGGFVVEGRFSWFIRIFSPVVAIVENALNIRFGFDGGAEVGARIWPLPWLTSGVKAVPVPNPPRAVASFFFNGRELVMTAGPEPFGIIFVPTGNAFPINLIIAAVLTLLGNIGAGIVSVLGLRLNRVLATLPEKFPGTDFAYEPKFKREIVNHNGNLAAIGELKFKP